MESEKKMRFEIFQDVDGKWRWNAKFRNGRSAGNGAEPFASERNVRRAIARLCSEIYCDVHSHDALDGVDIRVVKRRK